MTCAWCSKEQGRIDPPTTSHGICERHRAEVLAPLAQSSQLKVGDSLINIQPPTAGLSNPPPTRGGDLPNHNAQPTPLPHGSPSRASLYSLRAVASVLAGLPMLAVYLAALLLIASVVWVAAAMGFVWRKI